ncbi:MAG: 3-oxoacyl-[acyl-carrier-protein] synthase III C-terminal domain-containing protein [Nostoc sp. CmiVER01]|uniref:3-oxoacyl-[acyl-carrier-protein] synthase III C-terminal domain-containing protein n=1 Tax=Nostoc sp. CmiVER01 TaxID=3075384 RepID=UPI003D160BD8
MINLPVGIRALAVSFPDIIRTNEYWQNKYPDLFTQTKLRNPRRSKSDDFTTDNNGLDIWSIAVAPYLSDPFRGNVERRVLSSQESSLTLEYRAAKDALEAAKLAPSEVELMIVASLFCEQVGSGNATYLAEQLKLCCPAWNLESTCSSALVALQNAHALVQTGTYRNVLVVISQIGSNAVDETDTLSWSMGDGAGAFVVDLLKPNQGILGTKIVNTIATHGAYSYKLATDAQGKPRICTSTGNNASMLAETAVDFVRNCCYGATAAAGVTFDDIDFFAFNTPTAWYVDVCTRALGIDKQRTINLYPRYANIGPVLPIANLYHAAAVGKISENNLVLVYTNGAAATAAAVVMRWGDVGLGQVPAPPISVRSEPATQDHLSQKKVFTTTQTSFSKAKLLAAKPEQQQQMLETYLLEWLATSLQLPLTSLDTQQSTASLLDSLMAIELRRKIEANLQVQVSIDKFLVNNIAQLAELLLNQLTLASLTVSEAIASADLNLEEREKLSL